MAPYTGTIPSGTLAVGAGLPAAWTQQVGLSLGALEGAWSGFTPALSGTGWAIGNGTAIGYYNQYGKTIDFIVYIAFGSTSTYGAGALGIGLAPTPPSTAIVFNYFAKAVRVSSGSGIYPLLAFSNFGTSESIRRA